MGKDRLIDDIMIKSEKAEMLLDISWVLPQLNLYAGTSSGIVRTSRRTLATHWVRFSFSCIQLAAPKHTCLYIQYFLLN